MSISFDCPKCRRAIRVRDEGAGRFGNCPHCKAKIRVPNQPTNVVASRKLPLQNIHLSPTSMNAPFLGAFVAFFNRLKVLLHLSDVAR